MAIDLRTRYLEYISALNARDWAGLEKYVAPHVRHNNSQYTWKSYATMIESFAKIAPDQRFYAEDLVVEDNSNGQGIGRVAVRIRLTATPKVGEDFAGVKGTGKTAEFWEFCFYSFEGGKIVNVNSLIDKAGLAEALKI